MWRELPSNDLGVTTGRSRTIASAPAARSPAPRTKATTGEASVPNRPTAALEISLAPPFTNPRAARLLPSLPGATMSATAWASCAVSCPAGPVAALGLCAFPDHGAANPLRRSHQTVAFQPAQEMQHAAVAHAERVAQFCLAAWARKRVEHEPTAVPAVFRASCAAAPRGGYQATSAIVSVPSRRTARAASTVAA